MRRFQVTIGACAASTTAMLLLVLGCDRPAATPIPKPASPSTATAHDHDGHEHGPHDGEIVELGGGEYHAEIVHAHDAHRLTVYLLDAFAKGPAAVSAQELAVNVTWEDQPRQFKLPAVADAGDPVGRSSRFELADEALGEAFDASGASARLSVLIEGQSFSGTISHAAHDHSGHEH